MVDMTPVVSSNIEAIGYDPDAEQLFVNFKNGTSYRYDGVPQHEYNSFRFAGSHGQYLNVFIKNNYAYTQL